MSKQEFALPAVGALIFDFEKRLFLMQSSGKFGDEWIIPGGKVNFGETLEEALKREIREETGLILSQCSFLGVRDYIKPDKHFIFLEFAAKANNPDQVVLNEEATQHGWFNQSELSKLNIAAPTRALIDERLNLALKSIFLLKI